MIRIIQQIRKELGTHYSKGEVDALSRILATELLQIKESTYFLKDKVTITSEQQELLDNALRQLCKYKPIQHILGYENFCNLRFKVNSSVLIPRPETQELVNWVATETIGKKEILDIGTGSGCIAISLAHKLPSCSITAWDISQSALSIAKENSVMNGCNIITEQKDILTYEPSEKEKFDIIVSNPPYIKEEEKREMEANVLDWEPHIALFVPDNDPLLFYHTIARKATRMLRPKGKLFFEINRAYGKETCIMLEKAGYCNIELRKDYADNDRMICATFKAP